MGDHRGHAHDEGAIRIALKIAKRHTLPQAAQSYTAEQQAENDRKAWGFFGYGAAWLAFTFPFGVVFYRFADGGDWAFAVAAAPWCFSIAVVLALTSWWRRHRISRLLQSGAYSDPQIRVEVREERLLIARLGNREEISYGEAATRITETIGGGDSFEGLVLVSGRSAIQLDDGHFKFGRTTAACLVARCVATGATPMPMLDPSENRPKPVKRRKFESPEL